MTKLVRDLFELGQRSGIPSDTMAGLWESLVRRYGEGHRYYHTLAHVEGMLTAAAECPEVTDSLSWAIWFHDVIYDPRSSSNEIDSVAYFRDLIGDALSAATCEEVERFILATDPRRPRSDDFLAALMVDLDLQILGAEPEVYHAYAVAIRKEYAFVSDEAFARGRREIMRRFLDQRCLYQTGYFQYLEAQARENIQSEIDALAMSAT